MPDFYPELGVVRTMEQLHSQGFALVSCVDQELRNDVQFIPVPETYFELEGAPDWKVIEWFIEDHRFWLIQSGYFIRATRNIPENKFTIEVVIQGDKYALV